MPVGDCERAFAAAAAADGIVLYRARVPWLNQQGHVGLPEDLVEARATMSKIFAALDGDLVTQSTKRLTSLPGDFVHRDTGTFIEIDESQHFTSHRAVTLDLYPPDLPLGFDLDDYRDLRRELSPRSDKYRQTKSAVGFGPSGRQRQRAYHDALRDVATPAMGLPPVVRVAAPEGDGQLAYRRVCERLVASLR